MRASTTRKLLASSVLACAVVATPVLAATTASANPVVTLAHQGGTHDTDHSGSRDSGGRQGRGPHADPSGDNRRGADRDQSVSDATGRRVDEQQRDSNTTDNRRVSDRDQPAGAGEAPWDKGHNDDAQQVQRVPAYTGR